MSKLEDYTASAGTKLYGRERELARLSSLARTRKLTIIYGPRGSGKRELALALASAIDWAETVVVDASLSKVWPTGKGFDALEDELRSGASINDIVTSAVEAAKSRGVRRLVVAVVDVDLMERYRLVPAEAGLGAASADVKSLSHNLTRGTLGPGVSVLLTSSNGFLGNLYVRGLLLQAATGYILLEGLDPAAFKAFMAEYEGKAGGCRLDQRLLEAMSGRIPGMAIELCTLLRDDLTEWVAERLSVMEAALAGARVEVSRFIEWDVDESTLIKLSAEVVDKPIKPLEAPHAYMLTESLAAKGLVYPQLTARGVVARDPHGLFKAALEEAASRGLGSLVELEPEAVIRRLLEASVSGV